MLASEYELIYRLEQSHWWYRGMEAISRALLARSLPPRRDLRILDAGCGTGAAMQTYLGEHGLVTGIDLSWLALAFCRLRRLERLACATVCGLPFPESSFDLVTCFDVLYARSVPNVLEALREFARVLLPGGTLMLRLPAYDWLRGRHDTAVGTARRFTTGCLASLLSESGLVVLHQSYANCLLFPLALVKRWIECRGPVRAVSDLTAPTAGSGWLFGALLGLEAPLVARSGLPFGLSVIAVAHKP